MAVTVYWVEWITGEAPWVTGHDNVGAPHTVIAATNINFGNTSARDLVPASFPIAAGSNSFTKYFAVQFSGAFTQISNAKIWKSAGAYVTDEFIQFSGSIGYTAPVTTDAADSNIPTAQPAVNNVGLTFENRDNSLVFPDLAAHSRTLPESFESNSTPGYYSGSRSSVMRFQLVSSAATPAGPANQKTISLTYDRS